MCVLIMTLGLLAGCGASEQATAGSLVEEAQKYTNDASSMKTHMLMKISMSGESLKKQALLTAGGGALTRAMGFGMRLFLSRTE